MKRTATSITLGSPLLERWLRYHYNAHKVTDIIMETSMADTVMTITLVGEKMPDLAEEYKDGEM